MDIKIDAVFSLANEKKNYQDTSGCFKEQKDSNQGPKTDMIVVKEEVHDPGYDFAEFHEKNRGARLLNESTDSAESGDLPFDIGAEAHGGDTPPALSMEKDTGMFRAMLYDTNRECMPPPVLMPQIRVGCQREEVSNEEDRSKEKHLEKKKKSMKIFPCYIVLTKVDRFLGSGTRISHRTFRKTYRECLNICKHVNFRRKLEAGQDVFNVKVPSKHKNYQAYLELHRRRHKSSKSKPYLKPGNLFKGLFETKPEKRYKDLIEKYKKSIYGRGAGRVMRSVQCFPKDFVRNKALKTPAAAKFISEARQQVLDETEREISLRRDLARLKNQIEFKRSANKTKKQYRLHATEHIPPYFSSGTSSVSGRVRKMNMRYGGDFARSKDEEQYFHSLSILSEKMRRDKKRIMEGVEEEKNDLSKRGNFELILDNAESSNEESFVRLGRNGSEFKSSTNDHMSTKERERVNSRRREKYNQKRMEKAQNKVFHDKKDGVIIKDIPDDCSVLNNLLLSSCSNNNTPEVNPDSSIKTEKPFYEEDSADLEHFSYVKSLLKRSSSNDHRNTIWEPVSKRTKFFTPVNEDNTETTGVVDPESNNMDPERARLFRIPDKVRQLFVKKDTPKTDVSETENSDKGTSQTPSNEQYNSMPKVTDNKQPKQLVVTGTPHFPNGAPELQKFVITSKGLAKPIVHVGVDVSKSKALPDFVALTTHRPLQDFIPAIAAKKNHNIFPKPVLLFENTGELGKISSVYPKIPIPMTTTAQTSVPLIKLPASVTVSSGDVPKTNVSLQKTSVSTSTRSDVRSQVPSKNASLTESKTLSSSIPLKSPPPAWTRAESDNSYYYFQVSGKNIIIPVKQGTDQQKAIVLNNDKPSDTKPVQTKASTLGVKGNQVNAMTASSKPQQLPTVATSYKLGDNMVALIPQANQQPLVVPLTPVRAPVVEPVATPNTQVIRVSPDGRMDTTQPAAKSLPTDNKKVRQVVPKEKQVLRMYPDGRTVLGSHSNPVRCARPPLLDSFNGKRFALIPTNIIPNTQNKKSSSGSMGVPVRFSLIPTSSTVLPHVSSAPRNATVVSTSQTVYQTPSSLPAKPQGGSYLPANGPKSENTVKVSCFKKGSGKPNIISKGSVDSHIIASAEAKVSDTIIGEAVKTFVKEKESDKNPEKAMAFSEATTAREEKLRKLKELLKERSMAVDKLREQRKNVDSESDDT